MATKKKKSSEPEIPYGITRGEFYGKGSQAKWNRGRYRKQAEAMENKHEHDENQSKEDNIRETQARLKNRAAWEEHEKRTSKKKIAGKKRGGVHKQGMSTVGGKKRTVKKRVAGK
jgi:t-SNARE complex subunit (syntaxin)